mgnify:CR=1 FL=1
MANVLYYEDIQLVDTIKAQFGNSGDFEIYHNNSTNVNHITSLLSRQLKIGADTLYITNGDDSTTYLSFADGGNATFTGTLTTGSTGFFYGNGAAAIKFGNTSALVTMSYSGTTGIIRGESGSALEFHTNGVNNALTLDTSQNATFAGSVRVNGWLKGASDTNTLYSATSLGTYLQSPTNSGTGGNIYFRNNSGTVFQTFSQVDGSATFSGDIAVGPKSDATIQVSENGNSTVKMLAGSVGRVGTYSNHNLNLMVNSNTALTLDTSQDALFASDVAVTAKLAVGTTSVHGSFDLYNQGTAYFNGAVTVDDAFTQSGGAASSFSGDLTVGDELTITTISNATADPNKFLVGSASNKVGYLTNSQVLSYIGAAPATGGAYLPLAGGTMTGDLNIDEDSLYFYNSSNNYWRLQNDSSGKLVFKQNTTQRGIWSSGELELTNDLKVGGEIDINGTGTSTFAGDIKISDNKKLQLGSSADLEIYHDGNNNIVSEKGDLLIEQKANDGDIQFKSDDGSGNTTLYYYLDGSKVINRFPKNVYLEDNVKLQLGDPTTPDLEIYHDGSHSYIKDVGTGNLQILATNLQINNSGNTQNMITASDGGAVTLYTAGNAKLATTSTGISVTGVVADRDIPCLFNSNFLDGTSSSIQVVPFNSLTETTVSSKTYYHYITIPYAGKLTRITMRNVSGSPSSSFTTQLFLYVNGTQQASSSELTISSSKITWSPTSSNTFAAGDELTFAYQKSASSKTWSGVSFGVAIELTDYDI